MRNDLPDVPTDLAEQVRRALAEDVGSGDISAALIAPDPRARARLITREDGVFCGAPWVEETCAQLDGRIVVRFEVEDGDAVGAGQPLFTLEGPAPVMLTAERTMLNFVQLLSGTATATRAYVRLIQGTGATLLDTGAASQVITQGPLRETIPRSIPETWVTLSG